MDITRLRTDYTHGRLEEQDLDPDPIGQFARWLEAAVAANLPEPNGMTLSTVGEPGGVAPRVFA